MARKKLSRLWSASAVPAIRDNLVRGTAKSAAHALDLAQQDHQVGASAAEVEMLRMHAHVDALFVEAFDDAGLYWVSADMCDVALDAAQDVPYLHPEHVPSPSGLMLLESPLPPFTTTGFGGLCLRKTEHPFVGVEYDKPVPIDGLAWQGDGDYFRLHLLVRTHRLPYPLLPVPVAATPFAALSLRLPADFTDPPSLQTHEGDVDTFPDAFGVLCFVAAAWQLMATPRVTETTDMEPRTGAKTSVKAGTRPEPGRVRVIEARPMRTVSTGDSDESGRRYTHRWVVRGHWRQQPHGAGRAQRRITWIESYLKGPEGAPIKTRDIVRAWRR